MMQDDDLDYGSDIQLDEELEAVLSQAESQAVTTAGFGGRQDRADAPIDIEDMVSRLSPFLEFRKKGWLSVSDLVGTVWCEVQYDYRLRTMPFLPPEKRPAVITSKDGASIPVNKVKVEGKERILKRGERIHKRLEREIHPKEIVVHAVTREDVWGLRFLNMFSALEALITLGKCRELPVVGFVKGILVMGIIDEVSRKPLDGTPSRLNTRSSAPDKSQTSLTSFFPPTAARAIESRKERTHQLFVSDSKTRASGTVPNEADTLAGRLQVMLYKELLDALLLPPADESISENPDSVLPTETPFSWVHLFNQMRLDSAEPFSESFVLQSWPIFLGNGLKFGVGEARNLNDMLVCWRKYVDALGLGTPSTPPSTSKAQRIAERNTARTEDRLELVYRRAGAKHRKDKPERMGARRKSIKGKSDDSEAYAVQNDQPDEQEAIQRAIEASLRDVPKTQLAPGSPAEDLSNVAGSSDSSGEDELALEVEMTLGPTIKEPGDEAEVDVVVRASQVSAGEMVPTDDQSPRSSASHSASRTPVEAPKTNESSMVEEEGSKSGSGSIIGRTVFIHSPRRLAAHLASVLQWWMGERDAVGVSVEDTKRCGWCEFEEGCEWRNRKAQEAMAKFKGSKGMS